MTRLNANGERNGYLNALYAFLLILPSFAGLPVQLYLLFAFTVLYFERTRLMELWTQFRAEPFARKNLVAWVVVAIVVAALGNKLVNGHTIYGLRDYYAPFYLFPLLVISSRLSFSLKLFQFLVIFTALESVVGLAEYAMGMRSFILDLGEQGVITDYTLLYESRVYGLSANSSILGQKLLIAFILIDFVKLDKKWEWLLRILLLGGLIVSFSRTPIIVALVYWGITMLIWLFRYGLSYWKSSAILFRGILLVFTIAFASPVAYQLTRGDKEAESAFEEETELMTPRYLTETNAIFLARGESDPELQGWGDKLMMKAEDVQSSGRKRIWLNYINFIQDHPWFGNGSDKLMFYTYVRKTDSFKMIHAHNSYLQLLATHGLLISFLFFVFWFMYWKRSNYLALAAILLYCAANYGIFYGFSYMDVIFLILLFYPLKPNYVHAGKG